MTDKHKHADAAKGAGLVRDANRMSVRILGWSVVLGLTFSLLISLSAPGDLDLLVVVKRGLIAGVGLGAAIIILALFLFPAFRRK